MLFYSRFAYFYQLLLFELVHFFGYEKLCSTDTLIIGVSCIPDTVFDTPMSDMNITVTRDFIHSIPDNF
jgi:hypothetical protein